MEDGNRDGILHRGIGHELNDLDPHLATQASDYHVLSALFEGLVGEQSSSQDPAPGVAERWEILESGAIYRFYLRPGVRWSNGDPLTAHDFVASFKRALTPSLGAENAAQMHVLRGAAAFNKGLTTEFSTVGVEAPDPQTLVLHLENPTPWFLGMLVNPIWFPVHLPCIAAQGPAYARGNRWTRPGNLIGNGPFTLEEWSVNNRIVVRRNPLHWDATQVSLKAVHFYPLQIDAEERAFRAGQLHVTDALPPSKIQAYRIQSPSPLRMDPLMGTYFFRLNTRHPPLDDPRVRRALSLCVDRTTIVRRILQGGQQSARNFTPPGLAGYQPYPRNDYDVTAARSLLAEAGFPGGRGLPPLELLFNSSETLRLIAEAMQETWRTQLGADVKLSNMENTSILDARRSGSFQLLRSSWTADYPDPQGFLELWMSDGGNNFTGWSNARYDALLAQARGTADQSGRFSLLAEAEALLMEESPIIPLHHYTHVFLLHPSVKGWQPSLLDHHPYKHVRLEA